MMPSDSDYGTQSWAQGLAQRLTDTGLQSRIGSVAKMTNDALNVQVMSLGGTTENDRQLEFQPVWGQRTDWSFDPKNPFRRNLDVVSEARSVEHGDASCPVMRVFTLPELNLLLAQETPQDNHKPNGRRRSPAETLEYLGIKFLGFVQNCRPFGQYRQMAIFMSEYGLASLPCPINAFPGGAQIWIEATYTTAADAISKGMGADFSTGGSGVMTPSPNTTPGSPTVADPVQVRFITADMRPFVEAGRGFVSYVGRLEKVNVGGAPTAASYSRIGCPGSDTGRYQIVLAPEHNRA